MHLRDFCLWETMEDYGPLSIRGDHPGGNQASSEFRERTLQATFACGGSAAVLKTCTHTHPHSQRRKGTGADSCAALFFFGFHCSLASKSTVIKTSFFFLLERPAARLCPPICLFRRRGLRGKQANQLLEGSRFQARSRLYRHRSLRYCICKCL